MEVSVISSQLITFATEIPTGRRKIRRAEKKNERSPHDEKANEAELLGGESIKLPKSGRE